MSKSIKYIFLICITAFMAAGVYLYKPISGSVAAFTQKKPCSEPMSFSIGTIDPEFGITEDEITAAAHDAASLWNGSRPSQPFLIQQENRENNKADILIHFTYDERQEKTDAELRFRERIRSEQIRLDQLQERHEQRREQFDERSQNYLRLADATTKKLNELNSWVSEKNEAGGFNEAEYEQFRQSKAELEQQQKRVSRERELLDQMAHTVNREMDDLNKKFEENNQLIEQYNHDFAGDIRFSKATYQRIGNRGVITVNQFMNKRELRLILAHELGHALGIDHLSNSKSVMHSLMGSQNLYPEVLLTDEDREAADFICS